MPEMRAACPSVSGRCWFSFCAPRQAAQVGIEFYRKSRVLIGLLARNNFLLLPFDALIFRLNLACSAACT